METFGRTMADKIIRDSEEMLNGQAAQQQQQRQRQQQQQQATKDPQDQAEMNQIIGQVQKSLENLNGRGRMPASRLRQQLAQSRSRENMVDLPKAKIVMKGASPNAPILKQQQQQQQQPQPSSQQGGAYSDSRPGTGKAKGDSGTNNTNSQNRNSVKFGGVYTEGTGTTLKQAFATGTTPNNGTMSATSAKAATNQSGVPSDDVRTPAEIPGNPNNSNDSSSAARPASGKKGPTWAKVLGNGGPKGSNGNGGANGGGSGSAEERVAANASPGARGNATLMRMFKRQTNNKIIAQTRMMKAIKERAILEVSWCGGGGGGRHSLTVYLSVWPCLCLCLALCLIPDSLTP